MVLYLFDMMRMMTMRLGNRHCSGRQGVKLGQAPDLFEGFHPGNLRNTSSLFGGFQGLGKHL
jgi:hypothetical protein